MNNMEILEELKEFLLSTNHEPQFNINQYTSAIENLIKEYKELKKQLNDIHSNFCKFNWKESNGKQVYNQLAELYESIYRKDK